MEKFTLLQYIKLRTSSKSKKESLMNSLISDFSKDMVRLNNKMDATSIISYIRSESSLTYWITFLRFMSEYRRYCKSHGYQPEETILTRIEQHNDNTNLEKVYMQGRKVVRPAYDSEEGFKCDRDCALNNECKGGNHFCKDLACVHSHFEMLGTIRTTDEIIDVINSVMVMPPAMIESIRHKLDS